MKAIISTLGALALLAGCACDENVATVKHVPSYDIQLNRARIARYGHLSPECPEVTNTQLAVAQRCRGFKQSEAISRFEAGFYGSTQAKRTGIPAYTSAPVQVMPVPVPVPAAPMMQQPFMPGPPLPLAPVAESPLAECVPGKPGYVISPFSPNAGYVDTNGMARGSEVRDPYSGKLFRIP